MPCFKKNEISPQKYDKLVFTAANLKPSPVTPTAELKPETQGRVYFFAGLPLGAAVMLVSIMLIIHWITKCRRGGERDNKREKLDY